MRKNKPYKGAPLAPLVLPAVYDDVLSYEEWLSKVIHRVDELEEFIHEQLDDVEALVKEEVDAMSAELRKLINDTFNTINQTINNLEARVDALDHKIDDETARIIRYVDAKCAELSERLLALEIEFDAKLYDWFLRNKQYTDNKFNEERIARRADLKLINDRLDQFSKEFPLVYCPAVGVYETVQEAIVDVWDSLRVFGLTAAEYDNFEFTAQEYADLLLTAFEYDVYGGYILKERIREMFNPFTGERANIRDVIAYMANLLKWNGKTAAEYDGYQFTAGDFDNSDYDAYPQDTSKYWTSPAIDLKNKSYKNYMKVYEKDANLSTQSAFSFTFDASGFKGVSFIVSPGAGNASEEVSIDGLGSFAISNDAGVRTVSITKSGNTITVNVSANVVDDTTDPVTTDNTKNLFLEAYRRASAYDVTELDA